jgi:hypothetical protein
MNEIEVTYDPTVVDELAISRQLNRRYIGFWRGRLAFIPVWCLGILAGVIAARLNGSDNWRFDAMVAIYTVIGLLIGNLIYLRIFYSRLRRALLAHSVRSEPRVNVLSQSGAKRGPHLFAWSEITEITALPGMTLLLLSPLDFIALPDASLPPGLIPESFRAQIAAWRAAAAP